MTASTRLEPDSDPSVARPTRIRWAIVILLFVFYTINSVDRSALSVALPFIGDDFHISGTVQGIILSAFFWSYCLLQIPGGLTVDKFGPRTVIGIASVIWGSFMALAGFAANAVMLVLSRIGLGAFEAPFMPAASSLVSKWMPPRKRASGVTLIDSGAPLGAAVGGLVVAWLIGTTGSWRVSFVIIGVCTVLFGLGAWLYLRNRPSEHRSVNAAEVALIEQAEDEQSDRPGVSRANVIAMVVGRLAWAMVFWGLVTWGPSYLSAARGLDLSALGFATFLIFSCGAVGEILSGFLADRLQRRFRRNVAFKMLFGGSGALSLVALVALPFVTDTAVAVALLCIGVFFNLFGGLYWTIPSMLAKPSNVGIVGGVMNFAGTAAGIIVPIAAGVLLDLTGGYTAVLVFLAMAAAVYLVGSLSINFTGTTRTEPARA
ncbi:ACS family D-galactonate transporter-like MFS transporter [Curtobacterium sp. PhB42]|uniref:MFS transporter n=1 Tax=unclassified Curtobacterium TaxID=257496 RepID=UPI001063C816|nr:MULTISPECIES: MFS transporter [unclassified Curtobacterium]TDW38522.1 ACS family D-galactonate transporter-like MFS transporter [Curtobacterium sp. PhB42]TDW50429.1 ACS family D-galactonate transporter-like MFS transporter [Curtobacterium sp. PhB190]